MSELQQETVIIKRILPKWIRPGYNSISFNFCLKNGNQHEIRIMVPNEVIEVNSAYVSIFDKTGKRGPLYLYHKTMSVSLERARISWKKIHEHSIIGEYIVESY